MDCKICGGESVLFCEVDFNKSGNDHFIGKRTLPVSEELLAYHKCTNCGYLFTSFFDDWENEDYVEKIYNEDYIKVDPPFESERPLKLSNILDEILGKEFKTKSILDYGGGSGKLVDLLQTKGYLNMENYDPFYHQGKPKREKYDVITCFEVIEHVPNQQEIWENIFSFLKEEGIIIFTTLIQPENINLLKGDWWYICPRNGHVGFHTIDSIRLAIERYNFEYQALNEQFHLIRPIKSEILDIPKESLASIFSER